MEFSPKVQPVQEPKENVKHKISVVKVLSGTKNLPPKLDELQPKSPASLGGKKH